MKRVEVIQNPHTLLSISTDEGRRTGSGLKGTFVGGESGNGGLCQRNMVTYYNIASQRASHRPLEVCEINSVGSDQHFKME